MAKERSKPKERFDNGAVAAARKPEEGAATRTAVTAPAALEARIHELEEALERERGRTAAVFDRAPDAYIVTDLAGVIEDVNAAFARAFGTARRSARGKPLETFVSARDRPQFRRALTRIADGGELEPLDLCMLTRQNRRHEFEVSADADLPSDRGTRGSTRWLLRDTRARNKAERRAKKLAADLERRVVERTAELEHERARLATMIEQMPAGVVLVSPSGEVMLSNGQVRRILGRDLTSPAGGGEIHTFHPDGRRYEREELAAWRVLRGEDAITETCEYERPDGTRIVLETSAFVVRAGDGTPSGVVTMFEDVTQRERRERAERDFVVNAAHELQSPIAAALAAAEALEAGAKDDPVHRDRFIRHITAACDRLARLTNALLVLARAEVGAEEARRELVPLAPLLRTLAAGTSVAPGVELRLACTQEEAALAHPGLLEQAVANLLANAAKHTRTGSISVETSTVDGTVEIVVADTGSGIAAEERERVTRRFFRGDRDREGFGLGLAIVDQAVRAMDGQLRIDSEVGRGTRATIVLPSATLLAR